MRRRIPPPAVGIRQPPLVQGARHPRHSVTGSHRFSQPFAEKAVSIEPDADVRSAAPAADGAVARLYVSGRARLSHPAAARRRTVASGGAGANPAREAAARLALCSRSERRRRVAPHAASPSAGAAERRRRAAPHAATRSAGPLLHSLSEGTPMTLSRLATAALAAGLLAAGAAQADPRVVNGCRIEPATNCSYAKLENADLEGVDLSDASLHAAVLSGANLKKANLQRVDLQVGNLSKADLRGANLEHAHLFANDLEGAQLEGANLKGVNFVDAKLQGANLKGADLTGALFESADLAGATWSDGRVCAAGSVGACK